MSGAINKVKEAISGDRRDTTTTEDSHSTSAGPHNTNTANKLDPRVGSGRDHRGATTTGYDSSTAGSTNYGPHNSNIMNKADPRIDSDRDHRGKTHTGTTGVGGYGSSHTAGSTNYGPHESKIANKLDPRVDSDRDNRGAHGTTTHGTTGGFGTHTSGTTTHGPHNAPVLNKADPRVDSGRDHRGAGTGLMGSGTTHTGTSGVGGYSTSHVTGAKNYGPHDSNIANKLDPRVDSDRDNRGAHGAHETTTHGTTGSYGSHITGSRVPGSTTHGPHSSDTANKLDPRVDSDRDHRAAHETTGLTGTTGGYGSTHSAGSTGTTTHGPHDSKVANKLDPRVDSDRDHRAAPDQRAVPGSSTGIPGTTGHGTHGTHGASSLASTGPAPNTAGPHKSDLLNKLDPRVDSDLDGSKTIGGNKTFSSEPHAVVERDRTDAAQVPPSAFKSHAKHEGAAGDEMHMNA